MSLKRNYNHGSTDLTGTLIGTGDLSDESKRLCLQPLVSEHLDRDSQLMDVEYQLVERNPNPSGISLVNPGLVAKRPPEVEMELSEQTTTVNQFLKANANNRLDMIGRQMQFLHNAIGDVVEETKMSLELHRAACNFKKKPGKIYHLYQKDSGQKYFSMLSPSEWVSPPHNFLGSYRLEADHSWTKANEKPYPGIEFLRHMYLTNELQQIM